MRQIIALFLFLWLVALQCLAFEQEEIKHLPGLNASLPFKQFSGYLDGGKGRHLFYWLVESEKNASTDPVVLWLNGGPGCSSLEGFFSENGPFRAMADGKSLEQDSFSWNKLATVLFLESPTNVGFSYNSSHLADADLYNDDATIEAKYLALVNFFKKYPHLKKNKFYITGESYGGIYIPLLTRKILDNQKENGINLQGIAIGNGVYDTDIMASSRIEFAYYHGLMGIDAWDRLQSICCHLDTAHTKVECDYPIVYSNYSLQTRNGNTKCSEEVGLMLVFMKIKYKFNLYYIYDSCPENSQRLDHQCVGLKYVDYLNQPQVKEALHVAESVRFRAWQGCNQHILMKYSQQYTSMEGVFRDIVEKHHFGNVILYSGDADIVCDFLSTQRFLAHQMKYKLKEASRPWLLDKAFAGVASRFENGLRFFTVHGAGHMVPTQRPLSMLAILRDLLAMETIA